MRLIMRAAGPCVLCLLTSIASASDWVGIYAIIHEAQQLPKGQPAEHIRLRGVFSLAINRREYTVPQYGWMQFKLNAKSPQLCQNEWNDLVAVAGSGEAVAFAQRHKPLGRVHATVQTLDPGIEYVLHQGVRKVGTRTSYTPIRQLYYLAVPQAPQPGATVKPQNLTLTASIAAKSSKPRFSFALQGPDGKVEKSEVIEGRNQRANWKPEMKLKPGAVYTWRVHVEAQAKDPRTDATTPVTGAVSSSTFRVESES